MVEKIIELQKKIAPESLKIVEKRYYVLKNIFSFQPIGRRGLANKLSMGERIVRSEVEILQNQGLIEIHPYGMIVTEEGNYLIDNLHEYILKIRGIGHIEEKLKNILGIQEVKIVSGNLQNDNFVLKDLGKIAADCVLGLIHEKDIIGITGGSTMAAVANGIKESSKTRNLIVVPARGGMGIRLENQSNTIAAKMAERLKCEYRLLHASDTLEEKTLGNVIKDPKIQEVLQMLKSANILVFGIGRADVMAERRELSGKIRDKLIDSGAVAEAFGYYFTKEGEIVYEMKTIGVNYDDFLNIPTVIGVAGGIDKSEAIMAICKLKKSMILITDESAALEIIRMKK